MAVFKIAHIPYITLDISIALTSVAYIYFALDLWKDSVGLAHWSYSWLAGLLRVFQDTHFSSCSYFRPSLQYTEQMMNTPTMIPTSLSARVWVSPTPTCELAFRAPTEAAGGHVAETHYCNHPDGVKTSSQRSSQRNSCFISLWADPESVCFVHAFYSNLPFLKWLLLLRVLPYTVTERRLF